MKSKVKLCSVALATIAMVLFLILVSSAASAAPIKITEKRITTNPSDSLMPKIYSDKIVWEDNRNGNWDIYIYDLSTRKELHTTNKSNQTNPDIYGNRVVWENERNGGHDIYMQDLSTKVQIKVTKSGKAYDPKIYGDKIVWADGRNGGSINEWGTPAGNWDIYMYDISTRKETQITNNTSMQASPDISGNRIVWEDDREWGGNQIGMYDLSTHKETLLDLGLFIHGPVLYGNRVVWITDADNLMMYDFSTSTFTHFAPNDVSTGPAIQGNRIVYTFIDRSSFISDVWIYDISTKQQSQITTNGRASSPDIYGNRIVWEDRRNGHSDIYMGTAIPVLVNTIFI